MIPIVKLLAFLVILGIDVQTAKLPDFIQKCSISEEIIKDCMMKQSKVVIKNLINGYKDMNVPKLSPFYVPELDFPASEKLSFKFLELKVYGLDTAEISDLWINTKTNKGYMKASFPIGNVLGVYYITGEVLMIPLNGKGPLNMTLIKPVVEFSFDIDRVTKGGKEYANVVNSKLDISVDDLTAHLGNLFNGNEFLEANMNKFLNDNWREILPDVYPTLTNTISKFIEQTFANIFTLPIDELFLP